MPGLSDSAQMFGWQPQSIGDLMRSAAGFNNGVPKP